MYKEMPGSWIVGNAQTDQTTSNIQSGVLFKYVLSEGTYRCPSDKSSVRGHPGIQTTRSYSLSFWLNGDATLQGFPGENAQGDLYIKSKYAQIANPVQVFAFAEDHEQSVDDGMMVVDDPNDDSTDMNVWWDLPADRHGQGCNLSFADGHVEHWHWRWPKKFKAHHQHAASRAQDPEQNDLKDLRRLEACLPGK